MASQSKEVVMRIVVQVGPVLVRGDDGLSSVTLEVFVCPEGDEPVVVSKYPGLSSTPLASGEGDCLRDATGHGEKFRFFAQRTTRTRTHVGALICTAAN